MAENSAISWCDGTVNFWLGCTEVGPACDHCYARTFVSNRMGKPELWQGQRQRTKSGYSDPLKWQRQHVKFFAEHGRRRRLFCNSLSDFFDNEVDSTWRDDAWSVIRQCSDADWYIVTKRGPNIAKMLPRDPEFMGTFDFNAHLYKHCVFIITVVTQAECDRDIPRLVEFKRQFPWVRIGLSIEPMLEFIFLRSEWLEALDWVIVGGESGSGARPMHILAATRIARACAEYKVPFHFKQVGDNHHESWDAYSITGTGKNIAEWPAELQIQEFPRAAA